jgi:hypothetical protein
MLERRECFIDVSTISAGELLLDGSWLLGGQEYELLRATVFGDLFLRDSSGRVHFLDTTDGSLRPFAAPEQNGDVVLEDRLVRREILMPRLMEKLGKEGKHLGPGQCYSPDIPPVLGGELEVENLHPTDVRVHVSVLGQIHCRVKNLTPGTQGMDVRIDVPGPEEGLV